VIRFWIDDCGLKRRLLEFDLFKIHNRKSEIRLIELKNEANQILSMVVASIKTARSRK